MKTQSQTKSLKFSVFFFGNCKALFSCIKNVENLPALRVIVTTHLLHDNLKIERKMRGDSHD